MIFSLSILFIHLLIYYLFILSFIYLYLFIHYLFIYLYSFSLPSPLF